MSEQGVNRSHEDTHSQIGSYILDVWWPIHTAIGFRILETDVVDVDAHVFSIHSANGA
jgi:hypothetical protein